MNPLPNSPLVQVLPADAVRRNDGAVRLAGLQGECGAAGERGRGSEIAHRRMLSQFFGPELSASLMGEWRGLKICRNG